MKHLLITLLSLLIFISCKQESKKETPVKETNTIDLETTKVSNQAPVIDYASFGMVDTDIPKGLEVGDIAPDVSFPADEDDKRYLPNVYKNQPVVIIFYRGYWCPACNKYLSELNSRVKEIEAKGAKVIAFTPETNENIVQTRKKSGLGIAVYSDTDGSIMKAFDVDYAVTEDYQNKIQEKLNTSIKETNNSETAVLPVPATFIINKEGKIVYKHFDPDYHNRASVDDILANIPE